MNKKNEVLEAHPISEEEIKKQIAEILRDDITFSPQIGTYVIHGAVEKLYQLLVQQPEDKNNLGEEWDGKIHMDEELWQQESPEAKKEWIDGWRREAAFCNETEKVLGEEDMEKLAEDYRINEGADKTERYLEKAFIAGYRAKEQAYDNLYRDFKQLDEYNVNLREENKRYKAALQSGSGVAIWYTKELLYDWLIGEKYSKEIATELAEKWAASNQSAFVKGWEKAINDKSGTFDYKYFNESGSYVWVKASERLPEERDVYFVRTIHKNDNPNIKENIVKDTWLFDKGVLVNYGFNNNDNYKLIEWLDESKLLPKEQNVQVSDTSKATTKNNSSDNKNDNDYEPYFGWCDVEGCENEGCWGGGAWKDTGYWTVCSKHSDDYRRGKPQPKMKEAAIKRELSRDEKGYLTNYKGVHTSKK